jgi:hypothetical protein
LEEGLALAAGAEDVLVAVSAGAQPSGELPQPGFRMTTFTGETGLLATGLVVEASAGCAGTTAAAVEFLPTEYPSEKKTAQSPTRPKKSPSSNPFPKIIS